MAALTSSRSRHAKRHVRVPFPALFVVVPVRWLWRLGVKRVKTGREAARQERRVDKAVERRVAALGLPDVEPTTESDTQVEVAPVARVDAARSWLFRRRRDVVAPVGAALVLIILRQVVHLASGWSYLSLALAGVPLLAVAVAGVWWLRQVDPRGVSHRTRVAAATTVTVALLWLASPARLPLPFWPHQLTVVPEPSLAWLDGWADALPNWPLTYLILTAWTGAAVWLRHRRFRIRPTAAAVPTVGPAEIWAETHGSEGWALAGTSLVNVRRIVTPDGQDPGWQANVACVAGKHNTSKVISQLENIAGVYGLDTDNVLVERTGNALLPLLSVMERDPFEHQPEWQGANLADDGTAELGPFYDGEPALTQLWRPGAGSFDSWFFGKKGSGKSTAVDNALASWMSRGLVCLDLTDMKGGTSLPQWADIAERYGTDAADGMLTLRRLDAIGQGRLMQMKGMTWFAPGDPNPRKGVSVLEPSEEWPIWLGVLEEAPQLWRVPGAIQIAERIMTLYRACLVSIVAISQMAELRQAWGNSSTLREQIQSGNVWAGYIGRGQANLGFDDFKPDLSKLEKGAYRSYLTSPAQSREAILRVRKISDPWAVARASRPGTPNLTDRIAIKAVEDRAAEKAAERVERDAGEPGGAGDSAGVNRDTVLAALRELNKAEGGPVRLGRVAARLAPSGMDDFARKRHNDLVGHYMEQLLQAGDVVKPRWGTYEAA